MGAPGMPSSPSRIRRAMLLGSGLVAAVRGTWAADPQLPLAGALSDHLAAALLRGNPLVVMVSLPGCPFCKVVRESHLAPMHAELGLPVVQVDMLSKRLLRDFKGASFSHERQIDNWGIRIAPTVLFFGRAGVEVAERLVGGMLPDFYGAYLDQRLETARKAIA
jgi:hypothetical protein